MQLEFGGNRYLITAGDNVVGVAPMCAVVLAGEGILPQHAILSRSPVGAAIRAAAPGATVLVNGVRISDELWPIRHGDTITIGLHALRVMDPEQIAAATPAGAGAGAGTGTGAGAEAGATLVAPSGATYRLADTMYNMPVSSWEPAGVPARSPNGATAAGAGTEAGAAALASFLVRTGEHKGRRLPVTRLSVGIGRAERCDVVVADPSVSAEHARLRWRDGLWVLTDVGSTNGTYVDGERVTDEAPLLSGASVRFGDVTVLFEPYDDPVSDPAVAERPQREPPTIAAAGAAPPLDLSRAQPASPAPSVPEPVPEASDGVSGWLIAAVIAAAAAGGAVGFVLLR